MAPVKEMAALPKLIRTFKAMERVQIDLMEMYGSESICSAIHTQLSTDIVSYELLLKILLACSTHLQDLSSGFKGPTKYICPVWLPRKTAI